MEWEENINKNSTIKNNVNNNDLSLNKNNKNNDLNLKNLEKLIHPIDNEFEIFIQNKIKDLEKLKKENKNISKNDINITNITNSNINNKNIKYK